MVFAPPSHPLHKLFHSTLVVLGLTLLARLSGAFKEVAVAHSLGTSALADQYVFAFIAATWVPSILVSVLTTALTPVLSKLWVANAESKRQLPGFLAQLWCACTAVATLLGLLTWLLFPYLSPVARAGGPTLAAAVGVVSFFSCLIALAGTLLVSQGRQIGAVLEGVPSLVLGGMLLVNLLPLADALIVGLVLGVGLQLLWLLLVQRPGPDRSHTGSALKNARTALRQRWREHRAAWKDFFSGLGYVSAGYVLMLGAAALGMWVASRMGEGSLASLSYATRITVLVTGLLMTTVNRVTISHFCGQSTALSGHWREWVGIAGAFTLTAAAATALLAVLAPTIVAILFERGQFQAEQTAAVSLLVRWHISQLAPALACAVLSAYLAAMGGFKTIFMGSLWCAAAEVACVLLGVDAFGMQAIAAAPAVGRVVMLAYFLVVVLRWHKPSSTHNAPPSHHAHSQTANSALMS
jgi:putative peptidoglycan lipid II flippase